MVDLKLVKRLIRIQLKQNIDLKELPPLYRGGNLPDGGDFVSDEHLTWEQRLPEKYRNGFELFEKVVITEPNSFFKPGQVVYVVGWAPQKYNPKGNGVQVADKPRGFSVKYCLYPNMLKKVSEGRK